MDFEVRKWYYSPEDDNLSEAWAYIRKWPGPGAKSDWYVYSKREAGEVFEVIDIKGKMDWEITHKLKIMSEKEARLLFQRLFSIKLVIRKIVL